MLQALQRAGGGITSFTFKMSLLQPWKENRGSARWKTLNKRFKAQADALCTEIEPVNLSLSNTLTTNVHHYAGVWAILFEHVSWWQSVLSLLCGLPKGIKGELWFCSTPPEDGKGCILTHIHQNCSANACLIKYNSSGWKCTVKSM